MTHFLRKIGQNFGNVNNTAKHANNFAGTNKKKLKLYKKKL
jgi:hypothetical protein